MKDDNAMAVNSEDTVAYSSIHGEIQFDPPPSRLRWTHKDIEPHYEEDYPPTAGGCPECHHKLLEKIN